MLLVSLAANQIDLNLTQLLTCTVELQFNPTLEKENPNVTAGKLNNSFVSRWHDHLNGPENRQVVLENCHDFVDWVT